jgi:hypothetical protein
LQRLQLQVESYQTTQVKGKIADSPADNENYGSKIKQITHPSKFFDIPDYLRFIVTKVSPQRVFFFVLMIVTHHVFASRLKGSSFFKKVTVLLSGESFLSI